MLPKRGPKAYDVFIDALNHSDLRDLEVKINKCVRIQHFLSNLEEIKQSIDDYEKNTTMLETEIIRLTNSLHKMTLN